MSVDQILKIDPEQYPDAFERRKEVIKAVVNYMKELSFSVEFEDCKITSINGLPFTSDCVFGGDQWRRNKSTDPIRFRIHYANTGRGHYMSKEIYKSQAEPQSGFNIKTLTRNIINYFVEVEEKLKEKKQRAEKEEAHDKEIHKYDDLGGDSVDISPRWRNYRDRNQKKPPTHYTLSVDIKPEHVETVIEELKRMVEVYDFGVKDRHAAY